MLRESLEVGCLGRTTLALMMVWIGSGGPQGGRHRDNAKRKRKTSRPARQGSGESRGPADDLGKLAGDLRLSGPVVLPGQ